MMISSDNGERLKQGIKWLKAYGMVCVQSVHAAPHNAKHQQALAVLGCRILRLIAER